MYHMGRDGFLYATLGKDLFWTGDHRNVRNEVNGSDLVPLDVLQVPRARSFSVEPTEHKTLVAVESADGVTGDMIFQRLEPGLWHVPGSLEGFTWTQLLKADGVES